MMKQVKVVHTFELHDRKHLITVERVEQPYNGAGNPAIAAWHQLCSWKAPLDIDACKAEGEK